MTHQGIPAALFQGKHVAVVGNAASLLRGALGPAIDACEVVIRMNRGFPLHAESQGRRTDVLAFSTPAVVGGKFHRFGAGAYLWMSPRGRDEDRPLPQPLFHYPLEAWVLLERRLGARPSVGAMVLDAVTACAPRAVAIFGFDFKQSLTFYTDRQDHGPHDYAAEAAYCTGLCAQHGWRLHGPAPDPTEEAT